jgi:hypothetical protein
MVKALATVAKPRSAEPRWRVGLGQSISTASGAASPIRGPVLRDFRSRTANARDIVRIPLASGMPRIRLLETGWDDAPNGS